MKSVVSAFVMVFGLALPTAAWASSPNSFFRDYMKNFFSESDQTVPPFDEAQEIGDFREALLEKLGLREELSSGTVRYPLKRYYVGNTGVTETCHVHITVDAEMVRVSVLNAFSEKALEFSLELHDRGAVYGSQGRGLLRFQRNRLGKTLTWMDGSFPRFIKIDQLELEAGQRRALNLFCRNLKERRHFLDRFLPQVEPPTQFGGGRDPFGKPPY